MISHTQALVRARKQSQAFLDYVVLACVAIPNLDRQIAIGAIAQTKMSPPIYFQGVNLQQVSGYVAHCEGPLARSAIITLFGYFEAYIHELLGEILLFHGGDKGMIAMADRRTRAFLATPSASVVGAKRKLQEPAKPGKNDKYKKYTSQLKAAGYRFPTELLASYGVRLLAKKAAPKGFKAWEITTILSEALQFKFTTPDEKRLEQLRTLRNDIAHGVSKSVFLKEAMACSTDLHALEAQIDKHAVEHFLVLEKFT